VGCALFPFQRNETKNRSARESASVVMFESCDKDQNLAVVMENAYLKNVVLAPSQKLNWHGCRPAH